MSSMNTITAATVTGKTVTERRESAMAIYAAASDLPDLADWQAVADALASVMPKAKAKKPDPVNDGEWREYPATKLRQRGTQFHPNRRARFVFSDGTEVDVSLLHHCKEDAPDWSRAARFACTMWRSKTANRLGRIVDGYGNQFTDMIDKFPVPEIVSSRDLTRDVLASPSKCNAASEGYRTGEGDWPETWDHICDLAAGNGGDWSSAVESWAGTLRAIERDRAYQAALAEASPEVQDIVKAEQPDTAEKTAPCAISALMGRGKPIKPATPVSDRFRIAVARLAGSVSQSALCAA